MPAGTTSGGGIERYSGDSVPKCRHESERLRPFGVHQLVKFLRSSRARRRCTWAAAYCTTPSQRSAKLAGSGVSPSSLAARIHSGSAVRRLVLLHAPFPPGSPARTVPRAVSHVLLVERRSRRARPGEVPPRAQLRGHAAAPTARPFGLAALLGRPARRGRSHLPAPLGERHRQRRHRQRPPPQPPPPPPLPRSV